MTVDIKIPAIYSGHFATNFPTNASSYLDWEPDVENVKQEVRIGQT